MEKRLSKRKLSWFRAFAVVIPLIILIVTELLLRVFDYGHDTSLFIPYPDNTDYWVMNKYASERYFTDTANATKGSIEPFKIEKAPNTCRIFVLGESTTAGYPYFHNGSFHRWLQYRLMHTYPNVKFEIINVSLTAVNSYTVLDFGKEVVKYQPDAVLVYTGHNEYYGALGIGSTSHIANNRFLVKTVLYLRKFRLVQLFDNIINKFKATPSGGIDQRDNLMKRMAGKQQIPYGSPAYLAGITQFQDNMDELCRLMQDKKIPMFLSTLVSNEKDIKPFISQQGRSESADEQFNLANASYKAGKYVLAKQQYDEAKELDMLRFRAPDAMNQIIVKLSQKYNDVHLVDTKSVFEQHSPNGVLGNETILEHVHPNLYGYALLSDAFYQAIETAHLINAKPAQEMSFQQLLKQMPVTKVDSLNGAYTIMMLETGWPFNKPIPADFKRGNTVEEQLAGALSTGRINWLDAMNQLFQYSMKANDKATALKAVEAVMLEYPQNTTYQVYAARLSFDQGNYADAIFYFKRLYDNDPSLTNTENMYLVLLKTDRPGDAVPYIGSAMKIPGSNPQLNSLLLIVNEIVDLEKKLAVASNDINLREQIAMDYSKIGVNEAAAKYKQTQ
ncbi:GDSL-like Lipase/Acylhydrolase family protein [Mucilaginibacter mallensis]|uniref:GDSL-like Lipase/Acylhydrolase family protein n=1 Tax=Mucilaginibacter mallensis TaxID=652787 RepID=A0A1H1SFY5_MUCMA|nr:GDSL-type esterase/lipase family protein [Mucilaginibacter mallensis]SDS46877.1 GDSL-like Lipase/Acylhydrolase family protein [Mucilaginibacter mallensis]